MNVSKWTIPPHLPIIMNEIPTDIPVAILLRHSVRPPMPPQGHGNDLELTEDGYRIARELGTMFGERLCSMHSSPILRCIQTAEALGTGAQKTLPIRQDRLLGDPGVYVLDGEIAGAYWQRRGIKETIIDLMQIDEPLPGMAAPAPAARFLVKHMLEVSGNIAGYHIFVTHDSIQMITASRFLPQPISDDHWPWFLDAIFFWRDGESTRMAYKDLRIIIQNIESPF